MQLRANWQGVELMAMIDPAPVGVPVKTGLAKAGVLPKEVSDDVTTFEAIVVPVSVPAGAITTAVVCAVTRPLPLVVSTGMAVDDPTEPGPELTVARVAAAAPGPVAVTSPVSAEIADDAAQLVFPTTEPETIKQSRLVPPETGVDPIVISLKPLGNGYDVPLMIKVKPSGGAPP